MGRSETTEDLGDAAAVTPSLYLGHYLPGIKHVVMDGQHSTAWAVGVIQGGGAVLTSSWGSALTVLLALGIPQDEAMAKVNRVLQVLPADTDIRF